jgi:hypothetical protein
VQAWYDAAFEREMGCTAAELRRWLPGAANGCPVDVADSAATVTLPSGRLQLSWQVLPERRIALMCLPRLAVQFGFDGVAPQERQRFMRYFDLYTQRGGG